MSQTISHAVSDTTHLEVDLKNPVVAGVLAWLWPGAGHLYQGRFGKAVLFMVCILITYFWGLAMGDGHVVYASLRPEDMRYTFLLQVGVGLPAMPALVQSYLDKQGDTLFGSRFMAPPRNVNEQQHDEKAVWHGKLGFYFELGSLFTMVAGLLNVLAIFDAYAGPAVPIDETAVDSAGGSPSETSGKGAAAVTLGALEMLGISLGIILALTLRARWELDNRLASYLMAAVGGASGYFLGRWLARFISWLRSAGRAPTSLASVSQDCAKDPS